jgi:hypothetical protein
MDSKLQQALLEYRTFSTDAKSKSQGKDFPRGEVMKTYNAHKPHPFVLSSIKTGVDAPSASLFANWKTWMNFDSQNPALVLSLGFSIEATSYSC